MHTHHAPCTHTLHYLEEGWGDTMHKHGLLPGQWLHRVGELDDLVAVDAAHPCVDVPGKRM